MDVQQFKKMGDLAKSLKEKGLASSMDDAMQLAFSFSNEKAQGEFSRISNSVAPNELMMSACHAELNEGGSINMNNEGMNELNHKISKQNNKICEIENSSANNFKFIKQIGSEIDKLLNRISSLETELKIMKQREIKANASKVETQETFAPKQEVKSQSSSVNPNEVDIRKYFYSGNDKK